MINPRPTRSAVEAIAARLEAIQKAKAKAARQMEIRKGSSSDSNSPSVSIDPKDTAKVIEILRANQITFDVFIDPNRPESAPADIFRFDRTHDIAKIQALIHRTTRDQA